ncbi:MAG: NDP-sugar synthase [Syntrophobacteraceae bacterium]|nr:NDP-sugar synthase [Syntrophobacteraceae bacterium]
MRAMILAAGLGTRLLPLTHSRPKALTPLRNVTMLEFWIDNLFRRGFDSLFLNAFHLKEHIRAAVCGKKWPVPVEVLYEQVLLGTGGAIRSAAERAGDAPLAVVNADVLCNADLGALYVRHSLSAARVSLLLHDCPEFNNVAVGKDGFVLGFGQEAHEALKKDKTARLLAFTGIHFIDASAVSDLPCEDPCDIIGIYRNLIAKDDPPAALFQRDLFWREMGSIESYAKLTIELAGLDPGCLCPIETGKSITVHPQARLDPGCRLEGSVVIGRGAMVCEEVRLENVILWDGVRIERGSSLKDCIVADGMNISGSHSGKIFAPVSL